MKRSLLAAAVALAAAATAPAAEPAKVLLVAGTNYFKPGEHDYVAGCRLLADLLRQTPGVAPTVARDWPADPTELAAAKAVVLFLDGGDKHPLLKGDRLARMTKLLDAGGGLVLLHQMADVPADFGDRLRGLAGGAWEKGRGKRAHWVATFDAFPDHPVFRGVKPFTVDDGWLTHNRFADGMAGVTPLLRTADPKAKQKATGDDTAVGWAFARPGGGRAVTFTGGHLHASFAQEGYRRFLANAVLWAAGVEVPAGGAKVDLDAAAVPTYLTPPPAKK